MNTRTLPPLVLSLGILGTILWLAVAAPTFTGLQRQTNGDAVLQTNAMNGEFYRIETTTDLAAWTPLVTVRSAGTDSLTDPGAAYQDRRFYRTVPLEGTNYLTGDHLATDSGDAILHPVIQSHACVLVTWNGKVICSDPSDPTASSPLFAGLPKADVIVVTHVHSDHYRNTTLAFMLDTDGVIFAPLAVYNLMTTALKAKTTILANGQSGSAHGIGVQAVGMYNTSNNNHPMGAGNGYVITFGAKRIYFSGDTEDIPEMRALTNIDVAFVCMSLPSNMTVDQAASAVREFKPKIVIPYHYQQATTFDRARFKTLVGTDLGIEVRLRRFYTTE